MTDAVKEKLQSVFRDCLRLTSDVDVEKLEYNTSPNWDSIAHMTLVAGIEETFDVMLDTEEVLDMSSFSKALAILGQHDVAG